MMYLHIYVQISFYPTTYKKCGIKYVKPVILKGAASAWSCHKQYITVLTICNGSKHNNCIVLLKIYTNTSWLIIHSKHENISSFQSFILLYPNKHENISSFQSFILLYLNKHENIFSFQKFLLD